MPMLDIGHAHLHYERIAGDPTRPLLVFLHEGLGCVAMWKDFPQRLCQATGCEGLLYDRLGYGQSSPMQEARSVHYLHEAALLELPTVLRHLAPGREHILVGHSDGGSIALIYGAGRVPALRGVVTAAAHVFVEEITLDGIRDALDAHGAGKLRGLERYHGDKAGPLVFAWADTWLAPAFAHWNIEYLLPSIACPLLALQGSGDQYGSPAQLDAIEAGAQRAVQLLVPGCGHNPHLEQPDAVLKAMTSFISRAAG